MKRMIKILMVALLMVVILVASISPAMARRISGGVLLPTTQPCYAIIQNGQETPREHLVLNPEGRAAGCWVLLPGANSG